jgi:general secretion pathway protein G
MKFKRNRGFSLLELLIIILIIALLVAVAIPQFADFKLRSQRTKAKQDIDVMINAIALFEQEEGMSLWDYARIPTLSALAVQDESTILGLLVGPYLKKLPSDPWGNKYIVDCEVGYVLSRGKNNIENNTDVLDNADIKVFYNSEDLQLKSATYVDVSNDGVVAGDKLYLDFTQTIALAGAAAGATMDLAGSSIVAPYLDTANNAGVLANDDPAAATPAFAAITHFDDFVFYTSDGVTTVSPTANSFTFISGYKDDSLACNYDTRRLVLTFANHADANAVAAVAKAGGFVNLDMGAATAPIIACDRDGAFVDRVAVDSIGYGIIIKLN